MVCNTATMERSKSFFTRPLIAIVMALALTVALAGCASTNTPTDASTTTPSPTPNMVGQWRGTYEFPTLTGELVPSSLLVAIERQENGALWGYEEYVDAGSPVRIPITGSLSSDGKSLGLAAEDLIITGELDGNDRMRLRFFDVTDTATSFEVELTRGS